MSGEKQKSKNKRAKNFKDSECELLLNLVKCYRDVVENKKTDGRSVTEKEEAWRKIYLEFNKNKTTVRELNTLKMKYENMKKVSKKRFSAVKQSLIKSGCEPQETCDLTARDWAIKGLISTQNGNVSNFDSASYSANTGVGREPSNIQSPNTDFPSQSEMYLACATATVSAVLDKDINVECGERLAKIKKLKEPKSSLLQSRRARGDVGTNVGRNRNVTDLSHQKFQLILLQKKAQEQEILHKKEEHELKIEMMKAQTQLINIELLIKKKQFSDNNN